MRPSVLGTRAFLTALVLAGAVLLLGPGTAFAAPALGVDCGAGASIMGSDSAGKVMVGTGVTTCTLTFTIPALNAPACAAVDETNGGGHPAPVGTRSTQTTLLLDATVPSGVVLAPGDVVSYICSSY